MEEVISTAETANLPSSTTTKLACFLVATGLALIAKGAGVNRAAQFIQQMTGIQDKGVLANRYGIKPNYINDNPKITSGFVPNIKTAIATKLANDVSVSTDELKFVKFAVLFASDPQKNPNYIDRARKFASTVSAAFLRNFEKVVDGINEAGGKVQSNKRNIADIYDDLDDTMEAILGRRLKAGETSVPVDTLKAAKLKSDRLEGLVKQYKSLKRQISLSYDVDFASYMSGKSDLVPVNEAYKHMKSLGYRDHKILMTEKPVPLKVGLQNGKLKYYTDKGLPLNMGIPSNAIDLTFSRKYDETTGTGAYMSYTSPSAAGVTRVYTEAHANNATVSKFNAADKVDASIDKVEKKWKTDLNSSNMITQMAATACMLIYLAGMRVGSRQTTAASATGEKTFGAISLRPRHVSITANAITLKYPGKKGVEQKHVIKVNDVATKRVAKNLQSYIAGKKGDTLVFSYVDSKKKEQVLTYSKLTNYLSASGYPAGIHKIRHVRGTNMVIDLLNSTKWQPSAKAMTSLSKRQTEADEYIINKIITPVTQLLGHKSGTGKDLWRTTVKSYINPKPIIDWYKAHDLRTPAWLPTTATKDD
jgi:DNA topoisomerase IB